MIRGCSASMRPRLRLARATPRTGSSTSRGFTRDPVRDSNLTYRYCSDALARRPTVLVVGSRPLPYNGMTVVTEMILTSELRRWFNIVHIDTSDHRPVSTIARVDATNVLLALRASLSFARALTGHDIDLVYIPIAKNRLGFLRDALILVPARLSRRQTVVHLHAEGFPEFVQSQPNWMRRLITLCLKTDRCHAVVLGQRLAHQFEGLIAKDRVHIVPNAAVDCGLPQLPPPPPTPTVLHLSTLWSAKGVFEVLGSAARLKEIFPNLRCVLAGGWYSPAEAEAAARFVDRQNLTDTVSVQGPVGPSTKRRLLAEATVMAFPSHSEGHPLVVLEALSASLPVVASDVGAIPEIVRDGKEGFIVPPRDPDALVQRLSQVLADPVLRARLSAAARQRYEENFTAEQFSRRLKTVWTSALRVDEVSDAVRNLRHH
jgi:glycosyltransferase involved in cell wall biosynthesis